MNGYDFILFDADDTLFDFGICARRAFAEATAECGIAEGDALYDEYAVINDGVWKRFERGELTREQLKYERYSLLFERHGIDCDIGLINRCYTENLGKQSALMPHAYEVCAALYGRARMFIITNGDGKVQRSRLAISSICGFFENVFISQEIGCSKPEKAFFDAVERNIEGFDKRRALIVGDSLTSDIAGAEAAGTDACLYDPRDKHRGESVHCKYRINDLRRLIDIIDGRG